MTSPDVAVMNFLYNSDLERKGLKGKMCKEKDEKQDLL